MKQISIDYSSNIFLSDETRSHLTRADICKEAIGYNCPFNDNQFKKYLIF